MTLNSAQVLSRPLLAVIGGSGFNQFPELVETQQLRLDTPYGEAVPLTLGKLAGQPVAFMPRHGAGHVLPPHAINYRANIWALKQSGAQCVLAVNAVGGIGPNLGPGTLAIPEQIIDYTHGREHTYFTGAEAGVEHIDFTQPYDPVWRQQLCTCVSQHDSAVVLAGVYGCTQGPRLETAAEVKRLTADGCDLVGMTAMPEAALARELALPYAGLAVVVNWAAGIDPAPITMTAIAAQLDASVGRVKALVRAVVAGLADAPYPDSQCPDNQYPGN